MWKVALVIVGCVFIFLRFGCEPKTPAGIGIFLTLVGAIRASSRALQRRRSNLPIFDYSFVDARLARVTLPKWPNHREILLFAAVGMIALALALFVDAVPQPG